MENEIINVTEEAVANDVLNNENLTNNKIGKVVGVTFVLGAIATGATVLIRKNKGKLKAMRISKMVKKLEKEGYTVIDASMEELD